METKWVKALGVDYGKARIGLATSDDLGMLAHPFKTISGKPEDNPVETLVAIIEERQIEDLIIGLPLHTDGRESAISKEVKAFIVKLRKHLGDDFPIYEVDELMTTKIARQKLEQAGRKKADVKDILDQAAAVEILQDWLNQKASAIPEIDLFAEED